MLLMVLVGDDGRQINRHFHMSTISTPNDALNMVGRPRRFLLRH
jgi:hypothetical protein